MSSTTSPLKSQSLLENRIVLVGMMGSGKTSVGGRLAARLGLPFFDSDAVLEAHHGMSVANFFARYGEATFREEEKKNVEKLLASSPSVVSLGGGAFVHPDTRRLVKKQALSVWLRADVSVLLERALRHGKRPLLEVDDPHTKMTQILKEREATYAEADIVVDTDNRPLEVTTERVARALEEFLITRAESHVG